MSSISFEKHLPRLFLAQIERFDADEPFTVRLHAAVMMTDISGFSALTARLTSEGTHGAETLQEVLDAYFGALGSVVERFGGDICTFAGDAMIAIWPSGGGNRDLDRDGASRALQCALAIQREAAAWSTGRDLGLSQRVAVASGEVLVSKLGGLGGRWLNAFSGMPIVEAGRACDITPPGRVLATPAVGALLGSQLQGRAAEEGCILVERVDVPPAPASEVAAPAGRPVPAAPPGLEAYVPEVLVRYARAGLDEWLAEFRVVTVMLAKLERIDFGDARAHETLQAMTLTIQQAVQRFGGAMLHAQMDDKGLNFVIAYGVPAASYEDDAVRALGTGLEIQRGLRAIGLRPSIGVATGTLYCGECGAVNRRQYSMIGPAINFAARLAGAAPDDLLSDEPTSKRAGERMSFTIAQNVLPKHADAAVLAFRPEWRQQPALGGRVGAMVGRAAELAGLVDALQGAHQGAGARLLVAGEPGIGKSRLLSELRAAVEAQGMTVVVGDAQSMERDTPYFLWREAFRALLGRLCLPGEPWRDAVRRHLDDDAVLLGWAPLLNEIVPLGLPETDTTRAMRGTARGEAIQSLMLRLVERACGDGPMVLIVNDLHWIDALSGSLLASLAERATALSIVVATRPLEQYPNEGAQDFCRHPALRRVTLGALDETQTADMIGRLLDVVAVPAELSRLVHARSNGNPFYIQQVALALRESADVEVVGGRCLLKPDIEQRVTQALPGTLRGVITSRVDRLGDEQQLLLKVASVFGRVFSVAGVAAIFPVPELVGRIGTLLASLAGSNLVTPEAGGDADDYAFSHALVQEAIYDMLPLAQRKRQHRRIADWLEAQHAGLIAGYHGLLARHCMMADEFPRAVEHLEGGAATAIRHSAYLEAIQHIETAQRLADERRVAADALRRARWHSLLGDGRHELSEVGPARAEYLKTLELLDRGYAPGALARAGGILVQLGRQLLAGGRAPAPLPAAQAEASRLASHAYAQLSEISYYENNPLAVLHLTLLSVREAQRCGSVPELSAGYGALAIAFGQMGMSGVARRYVQRGIELAESRPAEIHGIAYAHLLAMVMASSQCDWRQLDASFERADALYGELGDRFRLAAVRGARATSLTQRGRFDEAAALLDAEIASETPDTPTRVRLWRRCGRLQNGADCGRIEHADIEHALALIDGAETPIDRLMAYGSAAAACAHLGDLPRALATARDGLALLLGQTPVAGAAFIHGPLGVVTALLAAWDEVPAAQRREHAAQVASACAMLRTYTQQVPSTRARGYFLLGCHAERTGSMRRALALWRRAAQAGATYSMPYDRAVALLALERRQASDHGQAEQAQEIFASLRTPVPELFRPGPAQGLP